jgi:hypothetical protein
MSNLTSRSLVVTYLSVSTIFINLLSSCPYVATDGNNNFGKGKMVCFIL